MSIEDKWGFSASVILALLGLGVMAGQGFVVNVAVLVFWGLAGTVFVVTLGHWAGKGVATVTAILWAVGMAAAYQGMRPDGPNARIRVTKVSPLALDRSNPSDWPKLYVHFENPGAATATGAGHVYFVAFSELLPTRKVCIAMQDSLLDSPYWPEVTKKNRDTEMYPGDRIPFITIPSHRDDVVTPELTRQFKAIENGKAFAVFAIAWKFKDVSSGERFRVTETAFWISGNLSSQHRCGRERTFLE